MAAAAAAAVGCPASLESAQEGDVLAVASCGSLGAAEAVPAPGWTAAAAVAGCPASRQAAPETCAPAAASWPALDAARAVGMAGWAVAPAAGCPASQKAGPRCCAGPQILHTARPLVLELQQEQVLAGCCAWRCGHGSTHGREVDDHRKQRALRQCWSAGGLCQQQHRHHRCHCRYFRYCCCWRQ